MCDEMSMLSWTIDIWMKTYVVSDKNRKVR